jgi:GxxExxY protein
MEEGEQTARVGEAVDRGPQGTIAVVEPARRFREPTAEEDALARRIIGAAIEVHRILGPGLLESVYEAALCIELAERGIPFVRQPELALFYKDHLVGKGRLDVVVDGRVVVELKSIESFAHVHTAQLLSYLSAGGLCLGLLINFNVAVLKDGIKRVVFGKLRR